MGDPAALDSLDYAETLTAVARLAVPEYADWCFVELVMPDGPDRARRDGTRRPVQARVHRGVRPPLSARPRLAGRLAEGHPHRRAGAAQRHPGRVLGRRRAGSRAAPADAGGRHRVGARGPHARARHGDRRHRARPQRLRPALHRGGPAAGPGPGRPLRAGDRQRPPAHGRPALARRPRGDRRGRRRRGDGPVGRRSPRLRERRGRAAARLHGRAGAAVRPARPADLPLRDVRRGRQRDPAR